MRLEQLSVRLLDWGAGAGRAPVIERLRERTTGICDGLPPGDEGRATCERFLNPAAPATAGA
jgi:hypothetical protein